MSAGATLGVLGTSTAYATDPPQSADSVIGASIPTSPTAPRPGETVAVSRNDESGHAAASPALDPRTASKPQTTQARPGTPPADAHGARHSNSTPRDPLAAATLDDAQLAKARGGAETAPPTDLHINQNNSTGTVSGNVASQLTTGSNNISDGAFSNSAGIPMVIQNSGNNVLIQSSTILNLQLAAPK